MADTYTIQFRRGMYADFDTSKIRPGEPVAILGNDPSVPSGKALYIAFAANDVRRLCSIEDISEMVNAGEFVGPQGPKGEKGDKGADGTVAFESLTPEQKESLRGISIKSASIDTDGNLIITFSDGGSEDVGNIMGPQGIQGPKGDKGDVGPQGPKGDKGDVGPKGDNMSDKQAAQIEQNKTDIASLKKETGSLKEDLSNKITKFYASSQGETHLADSDNGKIMDMMLYGKSEQKQYRGKNLINSDEYYSKYKQNDGTYKGKASEFNKILVPISKYIGTQITVSCKVTVPLDTTSVLIEATINGAVTKANRIESGKSGVIALTISPRTESDTIKITYGDGGDGIVVASEFQIEKGSEVTPYEPYVGGQPSPSPDYPQEIKSVVNPTVKVCGKNLFDSKKFPIILNRGLDTNTGNIYQTMSGKYCATEKYIPFPYSGKKISFNASMSLCAYDQDYKFISSVNKYDGQVPSGTIYVRFDIKTEDKDKAQIELSENATPYEPYHEQTVTLPYTLNAIPVSSGGNVTIDGQQYIADYVDVERGKLVRMCKEYVITGSERLAMYWLGNASYLRNVCCINNFENIVLYDGINPLAMSDMFIGKISENADDERAIYLMLRGSGDKTLAIKFLDSDGITTVDLAKQWLIEHKPKTVFVLSTPEEIDLTSEEVQAFKALATYYPITNISINSEQLDGYTVLNYPISMENGWNYVKQQIGDTRDYIYDMDIQSAEAYVNSEYAVALTELEV